MPWLDGPDQLDLAPGSFSKLNGISSSQTSCVSKKKTKQSMSLKMDQLLNLRCECRASDQGAWESPGVGEERLFWLYLAQFATRGHGNWTDPEGYLDRSGGGGGMVRKESAVVWEFSKCSPWDSSVSLAWKLPEMQILSPAPPHPPPALPNQTLWGYTQQSVF